MDETQQSDPNSTPAGPPPSWDEIKSSPTYQQLDPNQRLAAFTQWHSESVGHANSLGMSPEGLRAFNEATNSERERLNEDVSQHFTNSHSALYDHAANVPTDLKPEGFFGTMGREVASKLIPSAATAVGGLAGGAGGAVVTPELGGVGAIPGAIAGGVGAGLAAEEAQKQFMGEDWYNRNKKQMEINAQEHPVAHQIGSTLTFLASMLGGGPVEAVGKNAVSKIITEESPRIAQIMGRAIEPAITGAVSGARAGAVSEAQEKGLTPEAIAQGAGRGAFTMGALGPVAMLPIAKTLIGQAGIKGPIDAYAMALAGEMYDAANEHRAIDFKKISEAGGGNVAPFVIMNALLGALHGMPLRAKSGEPAPPEAKTTKEEIDAGLQQRQADLEKELQEKGTLSEDKQKNLDDLRGLAAQRGETALAPEVPTKIIPPESETIAERTARILDEKEASAPAEEKPFEHNGVTMAEAKNQGPEAVEAIQQKLGVSRDEAISRLAQARNAFGLIAAPMPPEEIQQRFGKPQETRTPEQLRAELYPEAPKPEAPPISQEELAAKTNVPPEAIAKPETALAIPDAQQQELRKRGFSQNFIDKLAPEKAQAAIEAYDNLVKEELRQKLLDSGETYGGVEFWEDAFGSGSQYEDNVKSFGQKGADAAQRILDRYFELKDDLAKDPAYKHERILGSVNVEGQRVLHNEMPNIVNLEMLNTLADHLDPHETKGLSAGIANWIRNELRKNGDTRLLSKEPIPEMNNLVPEGKEILSLPEAKPEAAPVPEAKPPKNIDELAKSKGFDSARDMRLRAPRAFAQAQRELAGAPVVAPKVAPPREAPKVEAETPKPEEPKPEPKEEPLVPFPEDVTPSKKKVESAQDLWRESLKDASIPDFAKIQKAVGSNEASKAFQEKLTAALQQLHPAETLPEGSVLEGKRPGFARVPTDRVDERGNKIYEVRPHFTNNVETEAQRINNGEEPVVVPKELEGKINPNFVTETRPDGRIQITGVDHPKYGRVEKAGQLDKAKAPEKAANTARQEANVKDTIHELTPEGQAEWDRISSVATEDDWNKLMKFMRSHSYTPDLDPTGRLYDAIQARALKQIVRGKDINTAYIQNMIQRFRAKEENVKTELPTQETGKELRAGEESKEAQAAEGAPAIEKLKAAGIADPEGFLKQINDKLPPEKQMTLEKLADLHGSLNATEGEAAVAPTKSPVDALVNHQKLIEAGFHDEKDPIGSTLNHLAQNGTTLEKLVSNLLIKSGVDFSKVKVVFDSLMEHRGYYRGNTSLKNPFTIYLNPNKNHGEKGIVGTLLHEAYHHVTSWKLKPDYVPNKYEAAAIKQLDAIVNAGREAAFKEIVGRNVRDQAEADKFVQFLKSPHDDNAGVWMTGLIGLDKMEKLMNNFDRYYGLASLEEAAAGIIEPKFHDFIASTKPTPKAGGGVFKNLLGQFRNWLTKLVAGRPVQQADKLNDYLEAASALGLEAPRTRGVVGTEVVPIRNVGLNRETREINLDSLSKSKQDAISKLLIPIKGGEAAKTYPFYFTSPKNSSWFTFAPHVPEEVKSKILSILSPTSEVGLNKPAFLDKESEADAFRRFDAQQKLGELRGSSERPLRGLDEALSYDGDITQGFGKRLTDERLDRANKWLQKQGEKPSTDLTEAKNKIQSIVKNAEDSFNQKYPGFEAWQKEFMRQQQNVGLKEESIQWNRDRMDRLFRSTKAGMEAMGVPVTRGGIGNPHVEKIWDASRELEKNPNAALERMAEIKSGKHGMAPDDVALFQAYGTKLFKAWKDAGETGGDAATAKQRLEAFTDDFNYQTSQAGETLQALKNDINIDTGSPQAIAYHYWDKFHKELKPNEVEQANQIANNSRKADIAQATAEIKLGQSIAKIANSTEDLLGNPVKWAKLTLKEKAAAVAAKIPEADGQLKFDWKDPVDTAAKLRAYLDARFSGKTYKIGHDNLTLREVGEIWKFIKERYLNGKIYVRPNELIESVANDLNIDKRLAAEAISRPKTLAQFVKDKYSAQAQQRAIVQTTRQWMEDINKDRAVKYLEKAWELPRSLAVVGHVNPSLTHAGGLLFRPSTWSTEIPSIIQAFRAGYLGDKDLSAREYHEKVLQQIISDPNYGLATKTGLAAKVGSLDDIGQYNTYLGRAGVAGNRAMDVLKKLRMDRWNEEYQRLQNKDYFKELSETGKMDVLKELSSAINSETGTTTPGFTNLGGLLTGKWRTFMFAPRLEGARWQQMIVDPIRATGLWLKGNSATAGEKWFRQYTTRRLVEQMGTMTAALAANAMVLKAIGSDDKINWLDPTRSDWLAFKIKGQTVLAPSSFLAPLRLSLSVALAHVIPAENRQPFIDKIGNYALGKVTPTITDIEELARAKQNYTGAPITEIQNLYQLLGKNFPEPRKPKDPISIYHWAATKGPIPLSATVQGWYDAMAQQGASPELTKTIIGASIASIGSIFAIHQHPTTPIKQPANSSY